MCRGAKLIAVLDGACTVAACAVAPPSSPTVMALPSQGKDLAAFQQEDGQCRSYAAATIGDLRPGQKATQTTVGSAAVGTALGAAAGAAIGAAAGNAGAGAAIGGATGLVGGTAVGANNAAGGEYNLQKATQTTVGSAAVGTALGAAAGAAIGAAAGNAGAGAAIGGATGLVGGTAVGANNAAGGEYNLQTHYNIAYTQCMYARGDTVAYLPPGGYGYYDYGIAGYPWYDWSGPGFFGGGVFVFDRDHEFHRGFHRGSHEAFHKGFHGHGGFHGGSHGRG